MRFIHPGAAASADLLRSSAAACVVGAWAVGRCIGLLALVAADVELAVPVRALWDLVTLAHVHLLAAGGAVEVAGLLSPLTRLGALSQPSDHLRRPSRKRVGRSEHSSKYLTTRFFSVTDDRAATVGAAGCNLVDGALEAVECRGRAIGLSDAEGALS